MLRYNRSHCSGARGANPIKEVSITQRPTRARTIVRAFATLGFIAVSCGIFYLTVQSPAESVALSSSFDQIVKSLVVHLGTEGPAGALAQFVSGIPVRRIGHIGEFFAFGLLASLLVIAWFSNRMGTWSMVFASLGLCLAGSLFDQVHKLFVPVRHFDWEDLPFDACGYLAAIIVVFTCYNVLKVRASRRES